MASRIVQRVRTPVQSSLRQYSSAGTHEDHVKSAKMWKYLTIFAVPPSIVAAYYNAFYIVPHHERPEYKEYEHLRIRSKPFPWGDGNHTIFHNPTMNAVPGVGYEKDPEHH
ncbi:cytochrome c oxidase subunit 6A2, mitochondrial-like [Watersipora subatra]|uniref:cytochrome c oxidase subunit 6A2, mitochondrial-like n=1 Tax=Watersipora subatra TaxID=2589382 RepID=UPI00355AD583